MANTPKKSSGAYSVSYSIKFDLPQQNTLDLFPSSEQQEANTLTPLQQELQGRRYGDQWIVIQNRLLQAISHLTLNERRLILFLSPLVRKETSREPDKKKFDVHATDFAKEYNISTKNVYGILSKIADSLLTKAFWFWNYQDNESYKTGVSWMSSCDYIEKEGRLSVKLDDTVIEMLTIFDQFNPFTKFQKEWITKLGVNGIIMLEMALSAKNNSNGYYTIEHLRKKFECTDTYTQTSDFKLYVLDRSIKEIKRYTPIEIHYEVHKVGRQIKGFYFSYKDTSQPKINNGYRLVTEEDVPFTMNDAQLNKFAADLSELEEVAKLAKVGESKKQFIERLKTMLNDPKQQKQLVKPLQKVNFMLTPTPQEKSPVERKNEASEAEKMEVEDKLSDTQPISQAFKNLSPLEIEEIIETFQEQFPDEDMQKIRQDLKKPKKQQELLQQIGYKLK